jgi:hypothetical protein
MALCTSGKTNPTTRNTIINDIVNIYYETAKQLNYVTMSQICLDENSPMFIEIRNFVMYLHNTAKKFQDDAQTWSNYKMGGFLGGTNPSSLGKHKDRDKKGGGIWDIVTNINLGDAASLGWQWLTGARQNITRQDFLQVAKDPALLDKQIDEIAAQRRAAVTPNQSTNTTIATNLHPALLPYQHQFQCTEKRSPQIQANIGEQAYEIVRGGHTKLVGYLNQQAACLDPASTLGIGIQNYMHNYLDNTITFGRTLKTRANYV